MKCHNLKAIPNSGSVSFTSDAGKFIGGDPKGRFPSNLIHDGSDEVVVSFSYILNLVR